MLNASDIPAGIGEFRALHNFFRQARIGTIWVLMHVLGYGRLPAQISFLAGNLREAVLGRNDDQLRQSCEAAAAIQDENGDHVSIDSYTRERWELLDAVSESLDRAHSAEQPLDKVDLSSFAAELSLLEALAR